jgi:hypothetical protein
MHPAQSFPIPEEGQKPALRDLPWLVRFGLRGLYELVRARIAFARLEAKEIPIRNRRVRDAAQSEPALSQASLLRISYVLPRLSDRLPWRSDCLVQAIAGQNWLSSYGAAGEIRIGVENPEGGEFGAHAWLVHGETVVTGGDIKKYDLILSDSRLNGDSDAKSR